MIVVLRARQLQTTSASREDAETSKVMIAVIESAYEDISVCNILCRIARSLSRSGEKSVIRDFRRFAFRLYGQIGKGNRQARVF